MMLTGNGCYLDMMWKGTFFSRKGAKSAKDGSLGDLGALAPWRLGERTRIPASSCEKTLQHQREHVIDAFVGNHIILLNREKNCSRPR